LNVICDDNIQRGLWSGLFTLCEQFIFRIAPRSNPTLIIFLDSIVVYV